jgi:hypothetical protein
MQQVLSTYRNVFTDPTNAKSGLKVLGELLRPIDASTPKLSNGHMTKYPDQSTHMVQLLMCPNNKINMVDPPIPKKGCNHPLPHIKPLLSRPAVDKYRSAIR